MNAIDDLDVVNELLFEIRRLGLDYRSNPNGPDGPWRAQCPLCVSLSQADDLPLTITAKGWLTCRHGCDSERIAAALDGSTPLLSEVPSLDAWLEGTPMDPAATSPEPLPTIACSPFLMAGAGILITGPTGGGRSSLIQAILYDAALAHERCAYLGHEVTVDEFNARAAKLAEIRGHSLGDELRDDLARVRYLDLTDTICRAWDRPEDWVSAVAERYEIVAIDPLSAVESALGLNFEQRNTDYIAFYDKLVQPLTRRGLAVLKADNVGHALEARGRAKGASAKQDRADVALSCSLAASPVGLRIRATKVRSARAPFRRGDEWIFDRDTQKIHASESTGDETVKPFRPTGQMERVSRYLEAASEPSSKRTIRSTIPGRNEYIDQALTALTAEGYIAHDAHGYRSIKPYREAEDRQACPEACPDDVPTVPTVPQACPDRAPESSTERAHRAYTKGTWAHPDDPVPGPLSVQGVSA